LFGAFTEGFDTRDLKEAKALLNALLSNDLAASGLVGWQGCRD
jgi:hypothetical protein